MKTQIHELRTRIDGLSQLVNSLSKPALIISQDCNPQNCSVEEMRDQLRETGKIVLMNQQSPIQVAGGLNFLAESYKSLLLSKAWLGKVLAELGEETPYKKYPVGVVGKTSRDAFFLAAEKGLDTKNRNECILLSSPDHFRSWVFSELILPEDLSILSEPMQFSIEMAQKEQVVSRETVEDIESTADKYKVKFNTVEYGGIKFSSPEFSGFSVLTYIEKIDWLREEIQKLDRMPFGEYSLTKPFETHRSICSQHLSEARFFLGFELSRLKEQSKRV